MEMDSGLEEVLELSVSEEVHYLEARWKQSKERKRLQQSSFILVGVLD